MNFVMAVAFICFANGCNTSTVRVEAKACHAPIYHAMAPQNGTWVPVTVGIRCGS